MREEMEPLGEDALLEHLVKCQRLALVGRISAGITHEVNNQLVGVAGYAQLLLDNEKAAAFEKELGKINTSAYRCRDLVNKVRRMSLSFGGSREFNNINIILESSLDLVRHRFKQKSHELAEDFSPKIPSTEVDTPAIEQAFLNIIQNSLEAFGDKGGRLTIKTRAENGSIVCTFDDNGPGLSEEARNNLFKPFYTSKAEMNCTGLGLMATRVLIEEHGGTISVGDSPEGGVCVSISLPIAPTG
jgi:C4-dicarboxylate-specific signal transduction histidine kinase